MSDDNKKALDKRKGSEVRLTPKNRKFIELIIGGVKTIDAHKVAGYSGNKDAAYALKTKLQPFIDKYYELEGVSRNELRSRLLNLLKLPCVDRQNKPINGLSFNQYSEVLKMLKEELDRQDSKQQTRPQITAFVIKTHAESAREQRGQGGSQIIDVQGGDHF